MHLNECILFLALLTIVAKCNPKEQEKKVINLYMKYSCLVHLALTSMYVCYFRKLKKRFAII